MTPKSHRKAFSLIELLVVITIIVMLIAMMGVAMNSARASGKRQQTRSAIAAIDAILQRHFASCESTPLSLALPGNATTDAENAAKLVDIGLSIRQKITADMPDSWAEVRQLKLLTSNSTLISARQRGYIATLDAVNPSDTNGAAECLFMIVMQGGLADCLTCSSLSAVRVGDTDVNSSGVAVPDGAFEFLDAWGKPIQYVLWPGAFQLPPGLAGDPTYFDNTVAPFSGVAATNGAGTLRPLVYSSGATMIPSILVNTGSYLTMGNSTCGDPRFAPVSMAGGVGLGAPPNDVDYRVNHITNYDDTVKK